MSDQPLDQILWFVAHTRPRCEKKLLEYCQQRHWEATLPLYKSVRKYRGKTVEFEKPLFPNYLFMRITPRQRQAAYQSNYVATLLNVSDQQLFEHQLSDILKALSTEMDICLAPRIVEGTKVLIKSGPLRGIEGVVETRTGMVDVYLRLDFIAQAAAVRIHASELEIVD